MSVSLENKPVFEPKALTKKDFVSDQMIRWCPGCGDFAILTAMQNALPQLGCKREDFVFISGIGCSSRMPYYINTYGFHTIHGRAPAIATGVKAANPKLNVWVVTGDGDALSIGGNHFIHAIRRNVDMKIVVFNNEIYGLTKGQFSPTSKVGLVTKSTPYGNVDRPFNPASLALGAGGTFFARATDTTPKDMTTLFVEAAKHKGTAVIEILQNCVIFNDKVHVGITNREVRADKQIKLEHGKPMLFGENNSRGIVLDGLKLKPVKLGENGVTEKDILLHDVTNDTLAFLLSQASFPEFPVPMGILRQIKSPTHDAAVLEQISAIRAKKGAGDLQKLLTGTSTWRVG